MDFRLAGKAADALRVQQLSTLRSVITVGQWTSAAQGTSVRQSRHAVRRRWEQHGFLSYAREAQTFEPSGWRVCCRMYV
jgi:hypothetical protein